jgi:hypothetical protein
MSGLYSLDSAISGHRKSGQRPIIQVRSEAVGNGKYLLEYVYRLPKSFIDSLSSDNVDWLAEFLRQNPLSQGVIATPETVRAHFLATSLDMNRGPLDIYPSSPSLPAILRL